MGREKSYLIDFYRVSTWHSNRLAIILDQMDFDFDIVAFVAGLFTTAAFLPQSLKIFRHKDSGSVSITTYLMLFFGLTIWIFWGLEKGETVFVFWQVVMFTLVLSVLILIFLYRKDRP